MLLCDDSRKSERRETGWEKKGEQEVPEFQNFWHDDRFMAALWAAGVGSVMGSERLGGRGQGAEGWRGWKATTAGPWLEMGWSWQAH